MSPPSGVTPELSVGRKATSPNGFSIPRSVEAQSSDGCLLVTPREREVLGLLVAGMRNRTIGAVLGITEATVRAHVKHLFRKLDVHTRTAAVATALRLGLVELSPTRDDIA